VWCLGLRGGAWRLQKDEGCVVPRGRKDVRFSMSRKGVWNLNRVRVCDSWVERSVRRLFLRRRTLLSTQESQTLTLFRFHTPFLDIENRTSFLPRGTTHPSSFCRRHAPPLRPRHHTSFPYFLRRRAPFSTQEPQTLSLFRFHTSFLYI
jgi:hypothetical protein